MFFFGYRLHLDIHIQYGQNMCIFFGYRLHLDIFNMDTKYVDIFWEQITFGQIQYGYKICAYFWGVQITFGHIQYVHIYH